jgi:hypothetical protein
MEGSVTMEEWPFMVSILTGYRQEVVKKSKDKKRQQASSLELAISQGVLCACILIGPEGVHARIPAHKEA